MSLLHDREVDFGTSETLIAGVLMHATDRNVTWFLKRTPELAKSIDCDKDKDCVHSAISDNGFMPFDMNLLKRNEVFYICAYSNMTLVPRESFEDILPEIKSCSNGFIIDDVSPSVGKVFVKNFDGYLTESSKIDIYWKGFDDNTDVSKLGYRDRIKYYSYSIGMFTHYIDNFVSSLLQFVLHVYLFHMLFKSIFVLLRFSEKMKFMIYVDTVQKQEILCLGTF
jgi:hypothetical protein